jgi:hypothetical protein
MAGPADGKFFRKNTGDLQSKMHAKYNARLCAGLRKSARARTMENNEKNNGKNNGKNNAWSNRNCRRSGIRVTPGGHEKSRRRAGAGDTRKNPRLAQLPQFRESA